MRPASTSGLTVKPEAWAYNKPTCSGCGETVDHPAELSEGLCIDCVMPSSVDDASYGSGPEEPEPEPPAAQQDADMTCRDCGDEVDLLHDGLCAACQHKQQVAARQTGLDGMPAPRPQH